MKVKSEYIVLPILLIGMLAFGYGVLKMEHKTISVNAKISERKTKQ